MADGRVAGPVEESTDAVIAALELASEELSPYEIALAAAARRLARMVDSPGFQALSPVVKEWRRHLDELQSLYQLRTEVDEEDPVERARRGLRAV